jgi:arsenate reductase (glutaredoxin)
MGIVAHSGMMPGMNTHCTLFGIPNCDTVKKARARLSARGTDHQFHDFKKQGVPETALDRWMSALGWQPLLNTRGTTWRKISEEERAAVTDEASARALMLNYPSVIKRPVIEWPDGQITVGLDALGD